MYRLSRGDVSVWVKTAGRLIDCLLNKIFLELDIKSECWKNKTGSVSIARAEPDGTRAETRFRLSPKRTSPFKSAGASVQSTAGSRGVRISFSNAGYTTFGGGVRVLATDSICQFPLHFPSRASPCATRFRTSSTKNCSSSHWCMACTSACY